METHSGGAVEALLPSWRRWNSRAAVGAIGGRPSGPTNSYSWSVFGPEHQPGSRMVSKKLRHSGNHFARGPASLPLDDLKALFPRRA